MSAGARIGYHCSHEQFTPEDLLRFVQAAEEAGFRAAMSADHFQPWSLRQGQSGHAWAWLEGLDVEHVVLATKLDKLTRADRQRHLRELQEHHQGPVLPISAVTGEGLDELWKLISKLLRQPPSPPSRTKPSPSTSPR